MPFQLTKGSIGMLYFQRDRKHVLEMSLEAGEKRGGDVPGQQSALL